MDRSRVGPLGNLQGLALVGGALAGMLLATMRYRSQFPWSYSDWTFWSVFRDLAGMPISGYGGIGIVLWLPLLGAAAACLHFARKGTPAFAALARPTIALVTGYLWMCLGDLVASVGV